MAERILVDTTSPQTVENKTLLGATLTSASLVSCTASADPTLPLGLATKHYVDSSAFFTGDVKLTLRPVAPPGWVLWDDGTIGNAGSGATLRANADTQALYELIWNTIPDQWCPVVGGRSASATADFNANRPLWLPRAVGRALALTGTLSQSVSGADGDVDIANDTFTVPPNLSTWVGGMVVQLQITSGSITPLAPIGTYVLQRVSATAIRLCTSPANYAQGIAINLTAKSSPQWTLSYLPSIAIAAGEWGGRFDTVLRVSELPPHHHGTVWRHTGGIHHPSGTGTSNPSQTDSMGSAESVSLRTPFVGVRAMMKL